MGNIRLTLGLAACLTAFATGCTSNGQVGQVKEVGQGTYSISVGKAVIGGVSQNNKLLGDAVERAGEYCHSKGLKISVTQAVGNDITFHCVSDFPAKAQ
jgi:hypothetical protein